MLNEAYNNSTYEENINQKLVFIHNREKMESPFRIKLLYLRIYFHNSPFYFIMIKFLLGLIFFTIPIFIFSFILKNALDKKKYDFSLASMPILLSSIIMIIYLTSLIIYRILSLFSVQTYHNIY